MRRAGGLASGTLSASRGSIGTTRRGCITTGIGTTTRTWVDSLGLQRSKGCPDALEKAKQEAARLRAAGGKLPTATCAMVNRRTGKVYTGTSGAKPSNSALSWG